MNIKYINISIELAQDLFNLINDAKHPHYESKIVEQVKNNLYKNIKDSLSCQQLEPQLKEDKE